MTEAAPAYTLLDGGMGRLLLRLGAPFRLPEWSALALIEAPDYVARAHEAYVAAGAEIITTNSYGLVPHMIGPERYRRTARAASPILAGGSRPRRRRRRAASVAWRAPSPGFRELRPRPTTGRPPRRSWPKLVAGSRPARRPLADSKRKAPPSKRSPALAVARRRQAEVHVAYTLKDEEGRNGAARVCDRRERRRRRGQDRCCRGFRHPLQLQPAGGDGKRRSAKPAPPSRPPRRRKPRSASTPTPSPRSRPSTRTTRASRRSAPISGRPDYVGWVDRWVRAGAAIVGGCCGIGPEHIAELRRVREGGGVLSPSVPASALPF